MVHGTWLMISEMIRGVRYLVLICLLRSGIHIACLSFPSSITSPIGPICHRHSRDPPNVFPNWLGAQIQSRETVVHDMTCLDEPCISEHSRTIALCRCSALPSTTSLSFLLSHFSTRHALYDSRLFLVPYLPISPRPASPVQSYSNPAPRLCFLHLSAPRRPCALRTAQSVTISTTTQCRSWYHRDRREWLCSGSKE
jgi:hypothetical protein